MRIALSSATLLLLRLRNVFPSMDISEYCGSPAVLRCVFFPTQGRNNVRGLAHGQSSCRFPITALWLRPPLLWWSFRTRDAPSRKRNRFPRHRQSSGAWACQPSMRMALRLSAIWSRVRHSAKSPMVFAASAWGMYWILPGVSRCARRCFDHLPGGIRTIATYCSLLKARR